MGIGFSMGINADTTDASFDISSSEQNFIIKEYYIDRHGNMVLDDSRIMNERVVTSQQQQMLLSMNPTVQTLLANSKVAQLTHDVFCPLCPSPPMSIATSNISLKPLFANSEIIDLVCNTFCVIQNTTPDVAIISDAAAEVEGLKKEEFFLQYFRD